MLPEVTLPPWVARDALAKTNSSHTMFDKCIKRDLHMCVYRSFFWSLTNSSVYHVIVLSMRFLFDAI